MDAFPPSGLVPPGPAATTTTVDPALAPRAPAAVAGLANPILQPTAAWPTSNEAPTPLPPHSPVGPLLVRIVQEHPGIHFRALAREAGLTSAGQLRHHLDRLERQGRLVEVQDGRFKRFFVTEGHDDDLRPAMARFARSVPRRIGKLLLVRPMNRTELRRQLGVADSTLGYHLHRLLVEGDLEKWRSRDGCRYALAHEDQVRRILLAQGETPPEPAPGREVSPWVVARSLDPNLAAVA